MTAITTNAAMPSNFNTKIDINMPTAVKDAKGSATIEMSLANNASTMVNIDMKSLAEKGYTDVNIDTDGIPGAEISLKVNSQAGNVLVQNGAVQGVDDTKVQEDFLLKIVLSIIADKKDSDKETINT